VVRVEEEEKMEKIECLIRELLVNDRVRRIILIIDYGKGEEDG